jgi:hypothetical protein
VTVCCAIFAIKFYVMLKRFFVLLLLSSVFAFQAKTNENDKTSETKKTTTEIKGKVVDIHNGEPLAGVLVSIAGTNMKTYTDFDGTFSLETVIQDKVVLTSQFISYKMCSKAISATEFNAEQIELALESL